MGKYFEFRFFFIYIEDVLTDTVNLLLMISTVYYNENKHNLCMII